MAIENPFESSTSQRSTIIRYLDIIVTSVFTFEVIIKILAKGLIINGKGSYL